MWTWSFELADVLTTLTIISIISAAAYRLVLLPILQKLDVERIQDRTFFSDKYDTLIETLKELKEEIKLSRQERMQQAQRHLQLVGRVDVLEARVNDLRNELHEKEKKIMNIDRINIADLMVIAGLVISLVMAILFNLNELAMSIASGLLGYIGGAKTAIHKSERSDEQ